MGNENKQILLRLQEIETLIEELTAIAPFPEDYFQNFTLKAKELRSKCSENITISTILEPLYRRFRETPLPKQLRDLEETTFDLILQHLNKTAENYAIAGSYQINFEELDAEKESPTFHFAPIIEDFKQKALEKNKEQLETLNQLLLPAKKSPLLLQKVNFLIEQLTLKPNTLLVTDKDIQILKESIESSQKKKRNKKIYIPEVSSTQEPTLFDEIKKQTLEFEELALQSTLCALDDLSPLVQKDFLLKPMIATFKKKTKEANDLIQQTREYDKNRLHLLDYQSQIKEGFEKAISNLTSLNKERSELRESILLRQRFLVPETIDLEELTLLLTTAKKSLQHRLEEFLFSFSAIDLGDKKDTDTIFFTKQLVDFINELIVDLQAKAMPLDSKKASELRVGLLQHLGEKTSLLSWKATTSTLEEKKINALLFDLFNHTSKEINETTLKKQLVAIYHLVAKLDAFPIKQIKNYHILKTVEVEQDKKIRSLHRDAQDELLISLEILTSHLDLFPYRFPAHDEVTAGKKTKVQLHELEQQFKNLFASYEQERSELLSIESPLERLQKITTIQETTLEQLAKTKKTIERLKKITLRDTYALREQYNSQKNQLIYSLKEALENAEAALKMHDSEIVIQSKVASQKALLEQLRTVENIDLGKLVHQSKEAIKQLNTYVTLAKTQLKSEVKDNIEKTIRAISNFRLPQLDNLNPFKADLNQQSNQSNIAVSKMNSTFLQLDELEGVQLNQWLRTLENQFGIASEAIKKRDETHEQAKKIEVRLESINYKASITVIDTLIVEFVRIVAAHIDEAFEKYPGNYNDLIKIKMKPQDYLNRNHLEEKKDLLNMIDPRLFNLLSMYLEFQHINEDYINKNLYLCKDKDYLDRLLQNVLNHLHNDHMEVISNGKRPQFIQWIRIYVFKPLQSLKHHVDNYLKPDEASRHRFFITVGACRTERELVNTGNEVYRTLAAPSA